MNKEYTYLDNAVTSIPLNGFTEVKIFHANPSSTHLAAREARKVIELTKMKLCSELSGKPYNYTFNSGATESANCIIQGVCKSLIKKKSNRSNHQWGKLHLSPGHQQNIFRPDCKYAVYLILQPIQ